MKKTLRFVDFSIVVLVLCFFAILGIGIASCDKDMAKPAVTYDSYEVEVVGEDGKIIETEQVGNP